MDFKINAKNYDFIHTIKQTEMVLDDIVEINEIIINNVSIYGDLMQIDTNSNVLTVAKSSKSEIGSTGLICLENIKSIEVTLKNYNTYDITF